MSETLTNGRKSGSSNKVGMADGSGGAVVGAALLLTLSMIVANSKEKWETSGRGAEWRGFGITTEKDFAPYSVP